MGVEMTTSPLRFPPGFPEEGEPREVAVVGGLIIEVGWVTPADAAQWLLLRKPTERNVRQGRRALYGEQMVDKRWHLTGEPILFDEDDDEVNGQHRLEACAQYGVSFPTVIIRNIPRESRIVVDTGGPRSAADALHQIGYKNCRALASITTWAWRILRGGGEIRAHNRRPRNEDMDALIKTWGLQSFTKVYGDSQFTITQHKGAFAALCAILQSNPPLAALAEQYQVNIMYGLSLTGRTDPCWQVRNRLEKANKARLGHGSRADLLRDSEAVEIMVRGWNAFAQGRTVKSLPVHKNKNFPKIVGGPTW